MKMPSLADGVFIWLSLAAGFFILRLEVEAPAVKEKKETNTKRKCYYRPQIPSFI